MDVSTVLKTIVIAWRQRKIRYALIGGLALGLWGVPRATVDVDFLVEQEDMPQVHDILTALGYRRHYFSVNVSQYTSDLRLWGDIDILHAFRPAARGMLARAVAVPTFQGDIMLPVVKVEDLIGLKVQAMVNDPSRRVVDEDDIVALLKVHGSHLDWQLLQEFFEIFQQFALFQKLREEYGPPE